MEESREGVGNLRIFLEKENIDDMHEHKYRML